MNSTVSTPKLYIRLQTLRLERWLSDIGLSKYVFVPMSILLFIISSKILFERVEKAEWIYLFLCSYFVSWTKVFNHRRFLKDLLGKEWSKLLHLVESLIIAIPFTIFLLIIGKWEYSIFALLTSFISLLPVVNYRYKALPTPFGRWPFELIQGFRRYFLLILLSYFLFYQALNVSNYNLCIFSLLVLALTFVSFYSTIEPRYFIWLHATCSGRYILVKIFIALIGYTILSLPILILSTLVFEDRILITVASYMIFVVYLSQFVVAKYSSTPKQISLPNIFILGLSIIMPPFILISFPFLYKKAKGNLNHLLEC